MLHALLITRRESPLQLESCLNAKAIDYDLLRAALAMRRLRQLEILAPPRN